MNNHEELVDTLADFRDTLKAKGFSDDQAFQLTREYMVLMLDTATPPTNQEDDEFPYNHPYDDTP